MRSEPRMIREGLRFQAPGGTPHNRDARTTCGWRTMHYARSARADAIRMARGGRFRGPNPGAESLKPRASTLLRFVLVLWPRAHCCRGSGSPSAPTAARTSSGVPAGLLHHEDPTLRTSRIGSGKVQVSPLSLTQWPFYPASGLHPPVALRGPPWDARQAAWALFQCCLHGSAAGGPGRIAPLSNRTRCLLTAALLMIGTRTEHIRERAARRVQPCFFVAPLALARSGNRGSRDSVWRSRGSSTRSACRSLCCW